MPKRRWRDWPRAFGTKINSTGGAVGLVGLGVGAAALVSPVGWVSSALIIGSGLTVAGSLGWAALASVPRQFERPENLIGKKLNVEELQNIDPPLRRLGLLGPELAGKTTLLDHIRQHSAANERTERVYAVVIPLPTSPISYVALIDGAGNEYVQQFKVADHSDIVVIILDHNSSSTDSRPDLLRLRRNEAFLEQFKGYLRTLPSQRPDHIHFMLNKQDLWEFHPDEADLLSWFDAQVDSWKGAGLTQSVTMALHSNMRPSSITTFVQGI